MSMATIHKILKPEPPFYHKVRVYIEDTDLGGVVYHSNYLKFAERARTEMFREHGYDIANILHSKGIFFAIRQCIIDYRAPAFLGDLLTIQTDISQVKPTRIYFDQNVWREDKLLAEIKIIVATIDVKKLKPVLLPHEVKQVIKEKLTKHSE